MKRRADRIAFVVVSFLLGNGPVALAGGGGEDVQSRPASVVKNLKALSRPDMPWSTPDLGTFSKPLREDHLSELDPQKEYELPELIDVAERTNPETKLAWARAKEA